MTSECALCFRDTELRDSHILPEFVYRSLYEDGWALEFNLDAGWHGRRRRGFSEPLLCSDCEGRFSKLESYFANVWINTAKQLRPQVIEQGYVCVPGLDYKRFKLFHMSLLWRMSVSRLPAFACVRLGAREETLRQMLLTNDPGEPNEFPFFGLGLRDPETGGWQDRLLHSPRSSRCDSQWVYIVQFCGVRWHYFASKHLAGRDAITVFANSGELRVFVIDWNLDPAIFESVPKIARLTPRQRLASSTE